MIINIRNSFGRRFYLSYINVVIAALLLVAFDAKADENYGSLADEIPKGVDAAQLFSVVQSALKGRGWEVLEVTPTSVSAELKDGVHDAKITAYRDGDALKYRDTSLDKVIDRHSVRAARGEAPATAPERWIKNLRKDISSQLNSISISRRNEPTNLATHTERLEALKRMLDGGFITQQDYDNKKAEILKNL